MDKQPELKNNVSLVIGGSGNIGNKIVEKLLESGGNVLATYNSNKAPLETLLKNYPKKLDIEKFDLMDKEKDKKTKDLIWKFYELEEKRKADNAGLIYASGIFIPDTILHPIGKQEKEKIWEINYEGAKRSINYFIRRGTGNRKRKVISAISSTASKGEGSASTYSSTKAALEALLTSTGEYSASRYNIRTMVFRPTWVDGKFLKEKYSSEIINQMARALPTYQLPDSEDVSSVIVENYKLALKNKAYNNPIIDINGGRS